MLLLVLVVPCTHMTAQAAPTVPVAGAGGTAGEYDHLDTALRSPGRGGRRAAVVRPAPASCVADGCHRVRFPSALVPAGSPPSARGPRSVVLRC
ncbi:hypothetical protein ACGH7X_18730 [Streptomyces sp. BBFR51]|uniref:hypothetical protein n=1 Tax=Streptomyces sp. BBFR51 TaxID=3372856 RepID=UPI0037DC49E9